MNFTNHTIDSGTQIVLSNFLPPPDSKGTITEIVTGLSSSPKYISSKFFYDKTGSSIFEEITRLPEYYPTITEKNILKEFAPHIVNNLEETDIIELGSGDCSKISILLNAVPAYLRNHIQYIPVDVSRSAIIKSAENLRIKYPEIHIHGVIADFLKHLGKIPGENRKLICFFGSTLGNLDKIQTAAFLINLRRIMKKGDQLLLGLDIEKDTETLEAAYNDSRGLTADFNRNILSVVNSYAKTDFNPGLFDHLAFYNKNKSRIEMHLRATSHMKISSPYLPETLHLKRGETIHTENSRKYSTLFPYEISELTGLNIKEIYKDPKKWFSVLHMECH